MKRRTVAEYYLCICSFQSIDLRFQCVCLCLEKRHGIFIEPHLCLFVLLQSFETRVRFLTSNTLTQIRRRRKNTHRKENTKLSTKEEKRKRGCLLQTWRKEETKTAEDKAKKKSKRVIKKKDMIVQQRTNKNV